MKINTLICFILSFSCTYAQDTTWFKDITKQVGLTGVKATYVQSADINGDNYPDLLVGTSGIIQNHSNTFTLYLNVEDEINIGSRKFIDITQQSGINISRIQGKPIREYDIAILFDVDNDGDLDLVSCMYYHRLEYISNPDIMDKPDIFLNDGKGHFTVKEDNGLNDYIYYENLFAGFVDGVGLSAIDFDYDSDLDLYIATKFKDYKNNIIFPDILMENDGTGKFTEKKFVGVQDIIEPLYGVNVTDYNNDGWQDVITSPYCRTGGRILKNTGQGYFIDVAQQVNYNAHEWGGDWYYNEDYKQWMQQPLCQWEAPIADFDNDGDMDILQCLIHGGYETREGKREGHTHIAVNQGPPDYNFISDLDLIHRNAPITSHLGDYGGLWVDFENNGWLDLVVCQGYYYPTSDRVYMCIQKDNHQFYDITQELGLMYIKDASNAQACDFDLDGDNDIFVFHSKDTPQLRLLRNDIANNSNWVSIKLLPPSTSNKDAIGARIRIYSDTLAQIREIQTGLGHFGGQEPFIPNFGLGKINGIDSIEIKLPQKNNNLIKIINPPMNIHLVIDSIGNYDFLKLWNSKKPIVKFLTSRTNFNTVNVGSFKDTTITIVNIGDSTLNANLTMIDSNSIFEFTDDSQLNFSIEPGQTKTVNIRFTPKQRLTYNAVLMVNSNAANGNIGYDLKGQGFKQEPMISASQNIIEFDSTKNTAEIQLNLKNYGELDLTIEQIEILNNIYDVFSIKETKTNPEFLPLTLNPNQTIPITVQFTPKYRENYKADLIISSNAFNSPNLSIPLKGIGNVPTPMVTYNKLFVNFKTTPINESDETTVKAVNTGDGDLIIENIIIEDNQDNVFSYIGNDFPITIPPNNDRNLTFRFTAKEQISYNRKAIIYSNAYNEPEKQLTLRGKGTEPISVSNNYIDENYSINILPNPVKDNLNISINTQNQSILNLKIIDLNGKELLYLTNILINKNHNLNLNISQLPNGSYLTIFEFPDRIITLKFIKN